MTLYDFCRHNDLLFSVTSEGAFCTSQSLPLPVSDRLTIGVEVGIGVALMMVLVVVMVLLVVIIRKKKGLLSVYVFRNYSYCRYKEHTQYCMSNL